MDEADLEVLGYEMALLEMSAIGLNGYRIQAWLRKHTLLRPR